MMASQWPAGVCSKGQPCIPVIPNDFTIHGYWPSNWNPNTPFVQVRYPMNMNDLAIALTTFPSLIDDMASEWPQLFLDPSRSNMGFWLMEYNAHGIYFSGTPHLYFNRALGVYEDYNPMFYLRNAGFVPDNINTYNTALFQQVLPNNPALVCFRNPTANNYILIEIRSCYAIAGMNINCQRSLQDQLRTCGGPNGLILFLNP
ncbi:Ribonuclease S-7 [Linum perenne]